MTNKEYAVCIYCIVFHVKDDDGDANTRGIIEAINTLPERDRIALESRYRHGKKLDLVGMESGGVSKGCASQIVRKALRKLRHPDTSRYLSISHIEKDRDMYKQNLKDADGEIKELKKVIVQLSRNLPTNNKQNKLISPFEVSISDTDFTIRAKNALRNAGKQTVKSVLEITAFDDLFVIRDLGIKSCLDVIKKMRQMGFSEWADNMVSGAICGTYGNFSRYFDLE